MRTSKRYGASGVSCAFAAYRARAAPSLSLAACAALALAGCGPFALAGCAALALAGCGAPAVEAKAEPAPAPPPPPAPSPPPPPPDPCDDGSCLRCGEGFCPLGFYCERPPGAQQPACAWAPRCARSPSCACLAPYLGGCRCEERDGGAHVTCE